ncbi:MAG: hypothetical protein HYZ28_23285 [Myxococcales bacterium]|nr:hypothetical protein [Myxococcales bacterium]
MKNGKGHSLQQFVKGQLEEARERFDNFEKEAEQVLKKLIARGKAQRKELEGLIVKLNAGELLSSPAVKQLGKRASQARSELRKRLDLLQARVVQASGVATQRQVRDINRELGRLSKKLDTLIGKRAEARQPTA